MTARVRHSTRLAAVLTLACLAGTVDVWAQDPLLRLPDPRLEEARQAYEATNYETARDLLDTVIAALTTGQLDPADRAVLAGSYELRGRTRQNLRDIEGARMDFRAMLIVDPTSVLPAQAGPRAQELFDEVRKTTVGDVVISVTPTDAILTLNGVRLIERPASVTLVAGVHTLAATRTGHRAAGESFSVVPGDEVKYIELRLERESSTLALTTAPANVEVLLEGVSRGFTEPDPAAAFQADVGAAAPSRPFTIENLRAGRHRLEFRRDCYIGETRNVDVIRPDDIELDLVRLAPAVATVTVSSGVPGGTVFVDGTPRGVPPQMLENICHGPHVFEVRTPTGRHVRRLDLRPGQQEVFVATPRPAFALVSDSGANEGVRGGPDLRLAAETAFQDMKTLTLFATPDARTAELFDADRLPADWLAFDVLRRPIGGAGTIGAPARSQISGRLARAFETQGVAAIAREPGADRSDMLLILLAPGSARPDVLRWRLENPVSVRQAMARLDEVPLVTRASLGLLGVDVLDEPGVVVATVEPGGVTAAAGMQPGDVVLKAGTVELTRGAAELVSIVNAHPEGEALPLEVRDRSGAMRTLTVTPQRVPRLVELQDQTVLSNALAVQYASRAYSAPTPLEETAVRLNLAAALMRLENWVDALRELEAVATLAAGSTLEAAVRDAVNGTVQYLMGACAEALGDVPGAERAWEQAAQSSASLLTESGAPLKELSTRRLNALRQARGLAR